MPGVRQASIYKLEKKEDLSDSVRIYDNAHLSHASYLTSIREEEAAFRAKEAGKKIHPKSDFRVLAMGTRRKFEFLRTKGARVVPKRLLPWTSQTRRR